MGDLFEAVDVLSSPSLTRESVEDAKRAVMRRCIQDRRSFGGLVSYRVSPMVGRDGEYLHLIEVVLPPLPTDEWQGSLELERDIAASITVATLRHLRKWVEPC